MPSSSNTKELLYFFQSFQLQLQSPSGNVLPPLNAGAVTQVIKINNPQKVSDRSFFLKQKDRVLIQLKIRKNIINDNSEFFIIIISE